MTNLFIMHSDGPGIADLLATPCLALVLLALVRADLTSLRLPDALTLPLLATGLALATWRIGHVPWSSLAGAGLGYAVFALFGELFFRHRGVEGLGLGDAKLLAAAGAWLGAAMLPIVVLIASLSALIYHAASSIYRPRADPRIAFGPWLAMGFAICWSAFLLS